MDIMNATIITSQHLSEGKLCSSVNTISSGKCDFVKTTEDCSYDGFLFNYMEMAYCHFQDNRVASFFILILVLLILFISIGIVADEFLCPSLLTISKTLKLPDNIAGVTFLAFGNGAPDIFSSIGGITQAKPELILSGLFGGGIFVVTVVAGSVLLTEPFQVMKRPIIRDITFYSGAAFLVWFFVYSEEIKLGQAISLICYYLTYIVVIIVSRYIYIRFAKDSVVQENESTENLDTASVKMEPMGETDTRSIFTIEPPSRKQSAASYLSVTSQESKRRKNSLEDEVILTRFHRRGTLHSSRRSRTRSELRQHLAHHHFDNTMRRISKAYQNDSEFKLPKSDDVQHTGQHKPRSGNYVNEIKFTNNIGKVKYFSQLSNLSTKKVFAFSWVTKTELKDFLIHACPVDILEWNTSSLLGKIIEIGKSVPYFVMTMCIPVVDLESFNENWCRLLTCFNIIFAPQIVLFFQRLSHSLVDSHFPLPVMLFLISIALVLLLFFTSTFEKAPVYHRLFSFVGFAISVVFINSIANEVISILKTIGALFKLTDSILGLTVLAWGNSLGDLISNLSMARHGYPAMAISACLGGPMLNLLMGLGVPFLIKYINKPDDQIKIEYTRMIRLLYPTLAVALCISLLAFILKRFRSTKIHGIILITLYTIYLLLAVMIEFRIIK